MDWMRILFYIVTFFDALSGVCGGANQVAMQRSMMRDAGCAAALFHAYETPAPYHAEIKLEDAGKPSSLHPAQSAPRQASPEEMTGYQRGILQSNGTKTALVRLGSNRCIRLHPIH